MNGRVDSVLLGQALSCVARAPHVKEDLVGVCPLFSLRSIPP